MELELYIAGIGGQGIQLMAKVLALAALAERRHVQLSAEYGFTMRGGSSLATVVLGATPLRALPVVGSAGAAIVMHQKHLDTPIARLRPGALVVTDTALVGCLPPIPQAEIIAVDASAIATEIGSMLVAGLALLAAFAAITGVVRIESLVEAMRAQIPSYRRQHVLENERAIRLGAVCPGDLRRPFPLGDEQIEAAAA